MGDKTKTKKQMIASRTTRFENIPLDSRIPFNLFISEWISTKKLLLFYNNRSSFV